MEIIRTTQEGNVDGPKLRVRQACEPCRRKKSKCPGERPMCSSCRRLGQNCLYVRHSEDYRVQKSSSNTSSPEQYRERGRIERLEARVDQILDTVSGLVSSIPSRNHHTDIDSTVNHRRQGRQRIEPVSLSESPQTETHITRFHPIHRPIPHQDVLSTLVESYIRNIDPLCLHLFDNETLHTQILQLPPDSLLLWSFLALTVRFTDHQYYQDGKESALAFYKESAQTKLSAHTYTFSNTLPTLQSCCLLIFCDILDSRPTSALFSLGVAARYALCSQLLPLPVNTWRTSKREEVLRCCWTLHVLDYTYGCSFNARLSTLEEDLPEKPRIILPLPTTPDGSPQYEVQTSQTGMSTNVLSLISIWGDMMTSLKRTKIDSHEKAWHLSSHYRHITQRMLAFETIMDMSHRLQHVKFRNCSIQQVSADKQYWKSWALMQILYHAIQAVLNHPLIHLLPERGDEQLQRPFSFLQHNVDYAILHSSWVTRIVELCEEKSLDIIDPFVGHLVSAAATLHFFFCFARDVEVVTKAVEDFQVCHRFVKSLAQRWPHLRHTQMKLSKIAQLLPKPGGNNSIASAPRPSETLFWTLLDYAASSSPANDELEDSNTVECGFNTQFVPRPDNSISTSSRFSQQISGTIMNIQEQEIDGFPPDLFDMPDMQVSMLADDFWIGGQL